MPTDPNMHNTDAHDEGFFFIYIKMKEVSQYLGTRVGKLSKSLNAIVSVNRHFNFPKGKKF